MNSEPGGWTESSVSHIFCHATVIGSVLVSSLNNDQVTISCLDVVRVSFGLDLHPVLQPVNLRRKQNNSKGRYYQDFYKLCLRNGE